MRKVVEEREALGAVEAANREATSKAIRGERRINLILDRLREVFAAAPVPDATGTIPPLVGLSEAAEILGTKKQYVTKLRHSKTLVPVEHFDSGPVFRRSDVEAHAKVLRESRDERERRADAKRAETQA